MAGSSYNQGLLLLNPAAPLAFLQLSMSRNYLKMPIRDKSVLICIRRNKLTIGAVVTALHVLPNSVIMTAYEVCSIIPIYRWGNWATWEVTHPRPPLFLRKRTGIWSGCGDCVYYQSFLSLPRVPIYSLYCRTAQSRLWTAFLPHILEVCLCTFVGQV